jgi:hypothetical protein
MSIPRYAIIFLTILADITSQLQKEYYKLVWDNRRYDKIPDLYSCEHPKKGGLRCIDLVSIIKAQAASMVARSIKNPELA